MRFICPWETVDGFASPAEFRSFERWMLGQVGAGMAKQVQVGAPFAQDRVLAEVWYLHLKSREVWRLVWPEPPFAGVFVRVTCAVDENR